MDESNCQQPLAVPTQSAVVDNDLKSVIKTAVAEAIADMPTAEKTGREHGGGSGGCQRRDITRFGAGAALNRPA